MKKCVRIAKKATFFKCTKIMCSNLQILLLLTYFVVLSTQKKHDVNETANKAKREAALADGSEFFGLADALKPKVHNRYSPSSGRLHSSSYRTYDSLEGFRAGPDDGVHDKVETYIIKTEEGEDGRPSAVYKVFASDPNLVAATFGNNFHREIKNHKGSSKGKYYIRKPAEDDRRIFPSFDVNQVKTRNFPLINNHKVPLPTVVIPYQHTLKGSAILYRQGNPQQNIPVEIPNTKNKEVQQFNAQTQATPVHSCNHNHNQQQAQGYAYPAPQIDNNQAHQAIAISNNQALQQQQQQQQRFIGHSSNNLQLHNANQINNSPAPNAQPNNYNNQNNQFNNAQAFNANQVNPQTKNVIQNQNNQPNNAAAFNANHQPNNAAGFNALPANHQPNNAAAFNALRANQQPNNAGTFNNQASNGAAINQVNNAVNYDQNVQNNNQGNGNNAVNNNQIDKGRYNNPFNVNIQNPNNNNNNNNPQTIPPQALTHVIQGPVHNTPQGTIKYFNVAVASNDHVPIQQQNAQPQASFVTAPTTQNQDENAKFLNGQAGGFNAPQPTQNVAGSLSMMSDARPSYGFGGEHGDLSASLDALATFGKIPGGGFGDSSNSYDYPSATITQLAAPEDGEHEQVPAYAQGHKGLSHYKKFPQLNTDTIDSSKYNSNEQFNPSHFLGGINEAGPPTSPNYDYPDPSVLTQTHSAYSAPVFETESLYPNHRYP